MKKILIYLTAIFSFAILFSGCSLSQQAKDPSTLQTSKIEAIPFQEDQLYAVAYLGYEKPENLSFYLENYLDQENLPVHYFSPGEYYLIIPRYANMTVELYQNHIETTDATLVFAEKAGNPFLLQCNISDIFPDVTIKLTYRDETVTFSPFISLKDGTVEVGEKGYNLTQ